MIDLNKEAEEYVTNEWIDYSENAEYSPAKEAFIAGANSKYVEQKILEAKLEGMWLAHDNQNSFMYRVQELEKQLAELTK